MQQNENEPRRAVITITEENSGEIGVNIEFFPSVGEGGACATLGMIGFQAIVNAYQKAPGRSWKHKRKGRRKHDRTGWRT